MKSFVAVSVSLSASLLMGCGEVGQNLNPVAPSLAAQGAKQTTVGILDGAPLFHKAQTTIAILDGLGVHHTITYDTGQDPCTLYDFGLESDPAVGVLTYHAPAHFDQFCRYKDGV